MAMLITCQEFCKGKGTEPRIHVWIENYSRRGLNISYDYDGKEGDLEDDWPSNRTRPAFHLARCTIPEAVPGFDGEASLSFGARSRSVPVMQGRSSCRVFSPGCGAGSQETHGRRCRNLTLPPYENRRNCWWQK